MEVVIGAPDALARLAAAAVQLLLAAVTATLDRQAASSPFLASVGLAERVRLAPADVPAGARGAALVARANAGTDAARVEVGMDAARVEDERGTV